MLIAHTHMLTGLFLQHFKEHINPADDLRTTGTPSTGRQEVPLCSFSFRTS